MLDFIFMLCKYFIWYMIGLIIYFTIKYIWIDDLLTKWIT